MYWLAFDRKKSYIVEEGLSYLTEMWTDIYTHFQLGEKLLSKTINTFNVAEDQGKSLFREHLMSLSGMLDITLENIRKQLKFSLTLLIEER